jgi:DNA-binding transcriptional regulator YdaS (Cro superfamily)
MQLQKFLDKAEVSQAELARRLSVSPGLVWQWLNGHRRIAAEQVLPIERATDGKVTRHDLRPDLYPRDQTAA